MENNKPVGLFIQINEKGQYIYADPFIKGGYLITSDKFKKYKVYEIRYILALLCGIVISTFIKNILASVIVGVLTAIIGEILFRVKFLPKCTYLPNYVKDKKNNYFRTIQENTPKNKKILKAILFLALAVLIVINAYQQSFPIYAVVISWIIGVIAFILFVLYLVAFIKDGGNK